MTVLLPRLDREQTQQLIDASRDLSVGELAQRMPERNVITTSSELGGLEIDIEELAQIRNAVVNLAREHGYPDVPSAIAGFEGRCARVLHAALGISPHEAAEEQVWSYFTLCWLMDVAVWRWGGIRDERRFRGDVNRNTFRRLWWRAEVFGPQLDLTQLGEDEFVNIMERPTIAANRTLARVLTASFLERVNGGTSDRMMLMRDACKHLVRLTPIVDFHALPAVELRSITDAVLDAAATGSPIRASVYDASVAPPEASECVEIMPTIVPVEITPSGAPTEDKLGQDLAALTQTAIGIARRAGRVTNLTLRERVPLDATDARRLLQSLVERGELRRRGRAKGTYYVVPDDTEATDDVAGPENDAPLPDDVELAPESTDPDEGAREGTAASDQPNLARSEGTPSNVHSPSPPASPSPRTPRGLPEQPQPAVAPAVREALRRLLRRG